MVKELNIALLQAHLFWENPEANRTAFDSKIAEVSDTTDLIILSEMFTTGFTMSPENISPLEGPKTLKWMQGHAKKKDAAIVGSMVYQDGTKNHNRLFFVHPDGHYDCYDKKHTFTLAGEHEIYEAGTERISIHYKDFKICPLICYDLRFPVWARNTDDYDVLLYVANWPKPRVNAWDTLLKARAIENMSYCIGVNRVGMDDLGHEYSGHSAVYDVLGEQLVFSNKEETLYATLSKEHIPYHRNKLKFLSDRDEFNLL